MTVFVAVQVICALGILANALTLYEPLWNRRRPAPSVRRIMLQGGAMNGLLLVIVVIEMQVIRA